MRSPLSHCSRVLCCFVLPPHSSYISVFRPLIVSETLSSAAQQVTPRRRSFLVEIHPVDKPVLAGVAVNTVSEDSLQELTLFRHREAAGRANHDGFGQQFGSNQLIVLSPNPDCIKAKDTYTPLAGVVVQAGFGRGGAEVGGGADAGGGGGAEFGPGSGEKTSSGTSSSSSSSSSS